MIRGGPVAAITGRLCAALAGMVVLAGCEAAPDLEAERAALLHADESWAAAAEAGDLERLFTYWTEGAVIYPPVGAPVRGLEAIRAFVREARALPGYSLAWTPTGAEVAESVEVGYTFGSWRRTVEDAAGDSVVSGGSYVSIWRKQADGSWKCSLEIASLGSPPNSGQPPGP